MATHRADRPSLAILLRILSGILIAAMFVCVKAVSDHVPLGEIVFFRSFFALIPLVIFLWMRSEFPGGLATKRPGAHLARSGIGALSLFGYFASISRLNLGEAVLIAQLSPVFMVIAGVILLSEALTVWRVGGLLLGLAGVVILVWPELGSNAVNTERLTGYFIGVVGAILSGISITMVRSLNRTESPGAIAFYFVIAGMIASLPTLYRGWVVPEGYVLILLVAGGLFGGLAHIAMTMAFRYAETTRLAPFEYIALLWPVLADLVIFETSLSGSFLLAAPVILMGAALAATEKNRKKHESGDRE